jgi:hypothetical protein
VVRPLADGWPADKGAGCVIVLRVGGKASSGERAKRRLSVGPAAMAAPSTTAPAASWASTIQQVRHFESDILRLMVVFSFQKERSSAPQCAISVPITENFRRQPAAVAYFRNKPH